MVGGEEKREKTTTRITSTNAKAIKGRGRARHGRKNREAEAPSGQGHFGWKRATPATALVSSRSTASHRELPAAPEPVPGSQRRTLLPATTRGVSSAVATHPGGAPSANNTGITSTGAWAGSLYDAVSDASRSTSNAISTPATGPITRLIRTEPTIADDAFFVCDLRDLEAKIKLWRQEMPRVTPFYAVKACSDPVILHILNFYGVNFDCSNKAEMMSVFDIGVSPERIVYANTVKCTSHLRFAQQRGVTLITFDSVEELDKIEDPNARLLLRIAANEYGVQQSMNAKYGITFRDASKVLAAARDMELNVVGVSFHVGCAYKHPEIFALTIEDARAVFDIGADMGFEMTVLDIGGGFPGGVRKREHFNKVCEAVRTSLDKHFPASSGVEIIGEPGQFFVTSAYTLVTKVVGKKTKELLIDGIVHSHENVYINESKYNSIPRDLYPFMDISYRPLEGARIYCKIEGRPHQ
ncbi:ornithine decarboxylase-like isoform X2 [Amblyomma americanum]